MKKLVTLAPVLILFGIVAAQTGTKASDKFPAGKKSPEGVACDLARAFINHDNALFLSTIVAGEPSQKEYQQFKVDITKAMQKDKMAKFPSPNGPKSIITCYAARHLSHEGPGSAAYALYGHNDVMFVDVKVMLVSGETRLNRTLVILDSKKRWLVHPRPDLARTLSMGLNDEKPSTVEWKSK